MTRQGRKVRMVLLLLLGLPLPLLLRPPPHGQPNKPAIADPALIDAQGYKDLLARYRGKPVMVYFWATWCEPCREEYPMVKDLARKYASRGLVILGVSLDDDAEINLVRHFLARGNPVFPNYRKKLGADEPFLHAVNPKWSGTLPATFFYTPDGRQAALLIGEQKRAVFEKAIQELLEHASGLAPTGHTPKQ